MSDDNANPVPPVPPAGRKRGRKAKSIESADSLLNVSETASSETESTTSVEAIPPDSAAADVTTEPIPALPTAWENAIGTLIEGDNSGDCGDPNSPADSSLSSALKREENLASSIVNVAVHASDTEKTVSPEAGAEYPGEHDPTEDPPVIPAAPTATETAPATEAKTDDATDPQNLERTVEALLFAAMEPITVREIARAADSDSATIRKVIKALKETGDREHRPWDLVEVANAYRFVTRAEFHPAILRLKTQTSQRKLTQAALETLALIAYRQPIGRAEIESIRGVNAGPVLRLLLEKKLVQISGRGTGLGQPLLYGTTDYFLENFGLKNVSELPKPGEFKNA